MTSSNLLLAAFITPGLFYGGAAAVAAPILIHLLARRRFKRIRWAAMDFLIDAHRRNRRRIRMEEWILLALRCLAVLLIALLVARPFIKPAGAAALWGAARQSERVFVLDDSLSMAYTSPDGTLFARAKLATLRLLGAIRQETPDDTVSILRMSAPETPVESGAFLEQARLEALLARLEALSPTQRSIDPAAVFEGLAEVLERSPEVTNAVVYLISDFQRKDWVRRDSTAEADGSASPTRDSIASPLDTWSGAERGLRIVLVNVGEEDAANLAVTDLSVGAGRLVAGATGAVRAEVANYSGASVDNLELQLSVGNRLQPSETLRALASGQSALVDLQIEFLQAGYESVTVTLPPDPGGPGLPTDNARYLAVDVASAIRVLIVNGEPATDPFDDEVTFLAAALRPEGELFSGNEITVIDEGRLEETRLGAYHLVVLANVYRVGEPAVEALERYTRDGGGVLIFLGDQVDADLYNATLYRGGDGILPAELTEIIHATEATHLTVTDPLHPAMRGVSGGGDPLGLGQVPFFEFFGSIPLDVDRDGVVNDGGDPGSDATTGDPQRPTRVLARFDESGEHPVIVERAVGNGRVILVTTTVDKEWHYWPDHPTFLPVIMEFVRHAARRGDRGRDVRVGEAIELPLDPTVYDPDAFVRTPAYPDEREIGLTAAAAEDGKGLALRWEQTDTAGFYQFVLKRRAGETTDDAGLTGGETMRTVAVNVDPRESDLTMAREGELRKAMGDIPFEYVQGLDALAGTAGEARTELWRVCLFAAVMVLFLEQTLAWFWGRKR